MAVVAVVVPAFLVASAGIIFAIVVVIVIVVMRHRRHPVKSDEAVKPLRLQFSRLNSQTSNTSEQQQTPADGNGRAIGTGEEQLYNRDSMSLEGNDYVKFKFEGPSDII